MTSARRYFDLVRGNWAVVSAVVVLILFVVVPLSFLLITSLKEGTPGNLGAWSLINYENAYISSALVFEAFRNTIGVATIGTIISLLLAGLFAWLVERTDMPGKMWVYAGVPLGLAVPGILHAIVWVLLLSPRSGFINRVWMDLVGTRTPLFDIYTMGGLIFAEGLRLVPVAFLMLVPLFRSMDPSLEEAAATNGASPFRATRRVTFMLLLPGLLAITIFQAISALETFEVPGILGLPVNLHVFSTRVFNIIDNIGTIPAFGQANAAAIFYLVIALVVSFFYLRLVRHSERYSVITGKGYTPRLVHLGAWRKVAFAFAMFFLFVTILLPFLILLHVSLVGYLRAPSLAAVETYSLKHYEVVLNQPRAQIVIGNTVFMTLMTATVVSFLSFLIAYIVVRTRFVARYLLDLLSFLPHSIPGIVLGLALFWLLLQFDVLTGASTFGSIYSLVLGFTIIFLAYSVRAMSVAMIQVHPDLEDAAKLSGAPPWRVAIRIFLPLLLPTLVGVWIYVALLSVRFVSLPLILAQGSSNEVLGVMIWYMWDNGEINSVGAVGIMLMTAMFTLAIIMRLIGFGRQRAVGTAI